MVDFETNLMRAHLAATWFSLCLQTAHDLSWERATCRCLRRRRPRLIRWCLRMWEFAGHAASVHGQRLHLYGPK
jgi:hypothetical protein